MNGFDPKKSLLAGLKTVLRLILGAIATAIVGVLSDSQAITAAFVGAGVPDAIAALVVLFAAFVADTIRNAYKHVPPPTDPRIIPPGFIVFSVLLALSGSASAQDRAGCEPSGGFLQYVERGQDTQNWTVRGLCVADRGNITFSLRGQLMRAQDASDTTPETVQAIEVFGAADRVVSGAWSVGVLGGTFFDVDSGKSLRDPRQWTVAGYVKYRISRGYVLLGAGHAAAVGGSGFVTALEIPKGDHASFVLDAGVPMSRGRFRENPFIIRSGVLLRK